ncbi:MAG: hypothetical protein JRI34_05630 [Deltaproteobacteria bacterium]|nr:hypothetical protein [Deltaproteobacteria bacterium]
MDDKFNKAVEKLLKLEGGYVNDPKDPGGETKFGISKRSYPDVDIANLTEDEAIEIYRRDWWEKYGYGLIEYDRLAEKVFDLAVNMGPRTAHGFLQVAVILTGGEKIHADGIIGPKTIAAMNSHPARRFLLARLRLLAIKHYVNLGNPRFLTGWIKRALA